MEIKHLDINRMKYPIGIDDRRPVFHFEAELEEGDDCITAVLIKVKKGRKVIWDSGKMPYEGIDSVAYNGPDLEPNTRYDVFVTLWNQSDEDEEIWRPVTFETGFLGGKWQAKWIGPKTGKRPCQEIKKEFEIDKDIRSARIYVAAYGTYELECNHQSVSNRRMTEESSISGNILYYQTYPATGIVRKGENTLKLLLTEGWMEESPSLLLQMELEYTDGSKEIIGSDDTFLCRDTYILVSNNREGEKWDMPLKDAMTPYRAETEFPWDSCELRSINCENLQGQPIDGVRLSDEISARGLIDNPKNEVVIDFGLVQKGSCRIAFRGQHGQKVSFCYGKMLDESGNFVENQMEQTNQVRRDTLICKDGYQIFEPKFVSQEFRYVKVEGVEESQMASADMIIWK